MDTLLKKAGAMLAHLDLFTHMLHLRGLLQLAAHMEERGDRVTLISPEAITLVGSDMTTDPSVTTSKGATIEAGNAYSVLRTLKGHDAPEYAVTREELKALNARAVAELEASDAMRAFGDTLVRIGVPAVAGAAAAEAAPERPARGRRGAEAEAGNEQPAA
ncbi:hypothetical protein [Deinococcus apachensis]|uniref:hypothetical protein n=1 Tax=Deinococcus apachensis TaxID=309886 RepID=UPI0003708FA5|nr:hypothetical protein [Deinococcus apachensis]